MLLLSEYSRTKQSAIRLTMKTIISFSTEKIKDGIFFSERVDCYGLDNAINHSKIPFSFSCSIMTKSRLSYCMFAVFLSEQM